MAAADLTWDLVTATGTVRVTAPAGSGNLLDRHFRVTGGIRATRGADVAVTPSAISAPRPDGRIGIHGDEAVKVEGPGYRLTGTGFDVDAATGISSSAERPTSSPACPARPWTAPLLLCSRCLPARPRGRPGPRRPGLRPPAAPGPRPANPVVVRRTSRSRPTSSRRHPLHWDDAEGHHAKIQPFVTLTRGRPHAHRRRMVGDNDAAGRLALRRLRGGREAGNADPGW